MGFFTDLGGSAAERKPFEFDRVGLSEVFKGILVGSTVVLFLFVLGSFFVFKDFTVARSGGVKAEVRPGLELREKVRNHYSGNAEQHRVCFKTP